MDKSCAKNQPKSEEEDHFSYAMELVNFNAVPMVLQAAIELQVLEIIAEAGPDAQLSPSEIATRLAFPNPDAPAMLDRMLRLLANYSILTCSLVVNNAAAVPNSDDNNAGNQRSSSRVYGLAPVATYFVRNQDGATLGFLMALIQDKVFIDSWYKLKEAVIEGGVPFEKVHGTHAFEYPARDQRFNEVFNKAMINHTTIIVKEILQCYQGFSNLRQLVDVGGGLGVTLNMITSKYPNIKGINFDMPHVIRYAPLYPGVEHVGGDMFKNVPIGDAIFMKWILHDWSNDHCLTLLKNCYKSLPDDGKVIVVEAVLPVLPDTSSVVKSTSLLDVLMMTQNPGGKERTEEEFLALAKGAGFKGITMECIVSNLWVMEFFK